ncbi:MAG: hypothetical protein ACOYM2_07375 [Rectinemataceae bacterium]
MAIRDFEGALQALDIRNELSHVYRKDGFMDLHSEILGYLGFFPQMERKLFN